MLISQQRFFIALLSASVFISLVFFWPSRADVPSFFGGQPAIQPEHLTLTTSGPHKTRRPTIKPTPKPTQSRTHPATTRPTQRPQQTQESAPLRECPPGNDLKDVLLVLKTGATEALQKLPYHLHSTLHCIPNYMIVSDLEQDIGSYKNFHVTDILANVNKTILNKYDEFKFYQQVKEYARNGQDLSLLKGDNAWKLDKWKNIPALYKAYKEYPNVKFYFFIDADSAFSLTNFLQWMKRLDAKKDLYCGSQVMYGDTIFAHGGSGYVISNSAAKKFVDANHGDYPGRWEHKIADNCCGDVMQSESLLDVGVPLTEAFPMFQGETPSTLDFHERIWCTPSITFHHMAGHEISALWHFEKNWTDTNGWNKPYLMCDVYHHFVAPYLQPTRNPWDNLSKDTVMDANNPPEDRALTPEEMIATGSFDECKAACTAKDDCLQFNWVPGRCQLGSRVIIGHVSENDEQKSGWLVERIKQQIAGYQKCTPNFSFHQ